MHIYIYRGRERERERCTAPPVQKPLLDAPYFLFTSMGSALSNSIYKHLIDFASPAITRIRAGSARIREYRLLNKANNIDEMTNKIC